MRLLIASFTLILTTVAALAQMAPPGSLSNASSRIGQGAAHASDGDAASKPKVNDKAYESALKNIPDKQYDPWRGVR
jgi:hypothetical protein